MTQAVTYVEIDVDYCSLTYGVLPCEAELGVTGERKCYNSLGTCQDRTNFTNEPVTLRFASPTIGLGEEIDALPCLESVSLTPATISLGEDLGTRATLTAVFSDFRHNDTGEGFDKYWDERGFNPYERGTFWGKFRARHPFLRGRLIRLIRGYSDQDLADMETRHYIIDSFSGPNTRGEYTIVGKDVLKLTDGDRSQAPRISNGFLVADITSSATTLTLSPAGVGNLEYPSSGLVAIGGKEIVSFTRSGDDLTITRAQRGTDAESHSAEDRVQLVLEYSGEDPADIINDLLVNYADVDPSYIPLSTWQSETSTHLQRLYTRTISEPTSVWRLVSDLIKNAALAVWWDDLTPSVQLRVLRPIPLDADRLDDTSISQGSLSIQDQPRQRISQVWTYFGLINSLRPDDDPDNYRSVEARVNLQAQSDYGSPSIDKIFAPWIPQFGRQVADRMNTLRLGRFQSPPRRFGLEVRRDSILIPSLGSGYQLSSWPIQDDTGARVDVPIQVTRLRPESDRFVIEAEEAVFVTLDDVDLSDRQITIDSSAYNLNLKEIHDQIYPPLQPGDTITFYISEGVIIGSRFTTVPALQIGSWGSFVPDVYLRGRIQGRGGKGGNGTGDNGVQGDNGGTALSVVSSARLFYEGDAQVWGGGGGGGGSGAGKTGNLGGGGGGGGAGEQGGDGGAAHGTSAEGGRAGTRGSGGAGGDGSVSGVSGGDGGGPGLNGQDGDDSPYWSGGDGGSSGAAITGFSLLTISGSGDVRGPTIG